jgi:hypothetical protein
MHPPGWREPPYDALVELWFSERPAAEQGRLKLREWKDGLPGLCGRWEDALLSEHVVVMPPQPAYGLMEGQD